MAIDEYQQGIVTKVKTIAVVNGGGDAPGLNAVIRAVVRSAIGAHGMRVIGIHNGFDGLIWPEGAKEFSKESVSGILPRGGSPTPFDRILATRLGVHATDLVARGEFSRMVCLRGTRIESVPLEEALAQIKFVDPGSEIVHAARAIGTTFGDSA